MSKKTAYVFSSYVLNLKQPCRIPPEKNHYFHTFPLLCLSHALALFYESLLACLEPIHLVNFGNYLLLTGISYGSD